MPGLIAGSESARRAAILSVISRKRSAAERRREDAARYDAEADALQAEADRIAAALAACPDAA